MKTTTGPDGRPSYLHPWWLVPGLTLILAVCTFSGLPAVTPTGEGSGDRRVDVAEVRTSRQLVAENVTMSADLRNRYLEILDETISILESAALDEQQKTGLERQRLSVGGAVLRLNEQLSSPEEEPKLQLPEKVTLERIEAELARERARLSANNSALREAEGYSEERSRRRNEIAMSLGRIDQQIVSIDDQLRSVSLEQVDPELIAALRQRLQARRQGLVSRQARFRAELALVEEEGTLVPLEIDLAQRRVAFSQRLVPMLERRADQVRRSYAESSLERVRTLVKQAESIAPSLAAVGREVEGLAGDVWGTDGVAARSAGIAREIATVRNYVTDLDRIAELTRREFAAFGYSGNIARWWPDIPDNFPRPGDITRQIAALDQQLPEQQHQLIRLEQKRAAHREKAEQLRADLLFELDEDQEAMAWQLGRSLMEERRDLLDALIRVYGRYNNQLLEKRTVAVRFLEDSQSVQTFLYERLLWARSVPRPVLPRPVDMLSGLLWLTSWENWSPALGIFWNRARAVPLRAVAALLAFALLLRLRLRMRRRLVQLADKLESRDTDSLKCTLEALLLTVLLAAPLPLALFTGHRILMFASTSTFLFTASQALAYVASLAALMELGRQMMAPRGLGEAHFRWPPTVTATFYRQTLWMEWSFLALMQVAVHFMMAGQRINSPEQLQLFNNAFGRPVFIIAMVMFGVALLGLLGRHRWQVGHGDGPTKRSRLHVYAVPVTMILTLVPATLAVFGYYITAILMSYQFLRTLWLAMALLLVGGIMFRWCRSHSRQRPEHEGEAESAAAQVADAQVRRLFRFFLVLAAATGIYVVWAEALPTLQIMKRVQVYPSIRMLDAQTDQFLLMATPSESPASTGDGESSPATAPVTVPGLPATPPAAAVESDGTEPLTLWYIFEALLALLITVELVKNIPGLLQLTLQRRSMMDSGARIAISTLVRYATIIIGVSVVFSLLGISWSRIQWLAAALTFGLGFGLQEIVANFVSGLILLTERPVRVGDAVTIGNLQGRVSRIQIRATTISLWDHSEMIVPNKEFITSKLVNWTLTDSRRRVDVKVRVAYGANINQVKAALLRVARENPDVAADPPSQVLLLEFGEDALKFELRVFVDFGNGLKVRDALHSAVDEVFRKENIEFALPQMNLNLQRRVKPRQQPGAGAPPAPAENKEDL